MANLASLLDARVEGEAGEAQDGYSLIRAVPKTQKRGVL